MNKATTLRMKVVEKFKNKRELHYLNVWYDRKPDFEIARGTNSKGQPNWVKKVGWYLEIEFMDEDDRHCVYLGANYETAKRRLIGTLGAFVE